MQVRLPLSIFFEKQTIVEPASYIERNKETLVSPSQPQQQAQDTGAALNKIFPLSYEQEDMWFLNTLEQKQQSLGYSLPMAFRLKGQVDIDALEKAIQTVIKRHQVFRTRFRKQGGQITQTFLSSGKFHPL